MSRQEYPIPIGSLQGRALCRRVLEQARADGYRAMQFNAVVETNTPAIRLWRSVGFQILATAPEAFRYPAHGYVGLHIMYMPLWKLRDALISHVSKIPMC